MNDANCFFLNKAQEQPWLRSRSEDVDIRFFLKGSLLDTARGAAAASREVLTPLLGAPSPLVAPKQVHGTAILEALLKNTLPAVIEADGVLLDSSETEAGEVEVSLRFADCAPVVVSSREGAKNSVPWVLIMHSGYKGTVQNIVKVGLEKLRDRYGSSVLRTASAWVGPCVGGEHYPRDWEEWTARGLEVFHKENVKAENVKAEGEKFFFDIAGELRLQLEDAGIAANRIALSGMDTFAQSGLCYSYRRGDRECRMFLWAKLLCGKTAADRHLRCGRI